MTKDELKSKLDELGVPYKASATVADLKDLLASVSEEEVSEEEVEESMEEESVEESEEEVAEEEVEEVEEDMPMPEVKDAVAIVAGRKFVRIYSKKDHGKDYMDLANEFISNRVGHEIVDVSVLGKGVYVLLREKGANGVYMETKKDFAFESLSKALKFAREKKASVLY